MRWLSDGRVSLRDPVLRYGSEEEIAKSLKGAFPGYDLFPVVIAPGEAHLIVFESEQLEVFGGEMMSNTNCIHSRNCGHEACTLACPDFKTKRDLAEDLELVRRARVGEEEFDFIFDGEEYMHHINALIDFRRDRFDIAEHAIERAIKAENLVSKTESILNTLFKWGDNPSLDDDYVDGWNDALDEALTQFSKAKEVLGDDSQGDNRAT